MPDHTFHPDLRLARFVPRSVVGPRTLPLTRWITRVSAPRRPAGGEIVRVNADVHVRVFRPRSVEGPAPALLWIHGGGYVVGTAAMADRWCRDLTSRLNVITAAVEYRLAPEYPFPIPLEDCYAGLQWLAALPGVDSGRIAIGGESAGGGLAAALALLAKERGEIRPVLQVLSYPMLDDRTTARTDIDPRSLRLWSAENNRFAWRAYLGPASGDISSLAAPARYEDLGGVAPAWIGAGTNDLFHDENLAYAQRLKDAGVPCELHVVPGAYHGFDATEPKAAVSREYREAQIAALGRAVRSAG
ncbi:alpha/beta hydrolase [Amycolatopsis sp. NEAU-NG30]|uniref:Alpha/beta hydrolase n=1 Tax=Amycolatopsis melonis TaxID=3156488 RepID=A0ABV0L835_9PSEU